MNREITSGISGKKSTGLLSAVLAGVIAFGLIGCDGGEAIGPHDPTGASKSTRVVYTYNTLSNPDRVEVMRNGVWAATFTEGSYTVALSGPARTFAETATVDGTTYNASVAHSVWVRTLPAPFADSVNLLWLANALAANDAGTPDVLAISMQYIHGAPDILSRGVRIAGDADYGPIDPNDSTKRMEGSDFNDYPGLSWTYDYDSYTDNPETDQIGSLDCSGFMRMIWGYRRSLAGYRYGDRIPLKHDTASSFAGMPRKSYEIYESGVGTIIIANSG